MKQFDATAKSPQVLFAARGNLQKMQFSMVTLQVATLKLIFASFSRIHQKISCGLLAVASSFKSIEKKMIEFFTLFR